jgi:amino acid transporter
MSTSHNSHPPDDHPEYESGSLSLAGTIAMGTGVMIGAGIFALTGQVAQFAGALFPLAFVVAAVISGFSAYSYAKVSSAYPSAGGIGMILHRAYGTSTITGGAALLMALSMVINESLVARTFATYVLQPFGGSPDSLWIPGLAVGLVVAAFLVNLAGNQVIGLVSKWTAALKVLGIISFAGVGVYASGIDFQAASGGWTVGTSPGGFGAGVALAVLAFKGFTTITNSGAEVVEPKKNIARAIIGSLVICTVVYVLVAVAVGTSLELDAIIVARDYALAEAARPFVGDYGVWFTVAIAIIATSSGILASMFAVSRMLAMLAEMEIIPHFPVDLPGDIQKHTLVYVAVIAALCAAFFDLGRIASMGAFLYLVMDMILQWGVLTRLHEDVGAHRGVIASALVLDGVALMALIWAKAHSDPTILGISAAVMTVVFALERLYLWRRQED